MKYQHYYDPVCHLIVEDFFDENEYHKIIHLIKQCDSFMEDGVMTDTKTGEKISDKNKKNKNLWLYKNRESIKECKELIDIIENKIWSEEMRNIYFQTKDSLFQYYHTCNTSDILLSKYTKNSYYNWHIDMTKSLTGNIWISEDTVDGGDLYLESNFKDIKKIEYRNNCAIFFPSECRHMVSNIKNDSIRYSFQYFTETIYPNGLRKN